MGIDALRSFFGFLAGTRLHVLFSLVNPSFCLSFCLLVVGVFEQSTLTLTLTGATCTALKGACPAVSPEVLLATRLPTVPEQTGAAAAAAASTAPVQLQTKETLGGTAGGGGAGVYVQQGEQQQLQQAGGGSVLEKSQGVSSSSFLQFAQSSAHRDLLRGRGGGGGGPPGKEVAEGLRERRAENRADGEGAPTPPASFLQVRADLEGDVRLMGLARAAAKLGAKTTEELMNQVRLQEKVQREAMEAVMDLIQVKEPATTSSFLGEATKSGVWVFATSPEVSGRLLCKSHDSLHLCPGAQDLPRYLERQPHTSPRVGAVYMHGEEKSGVSEVYVQRERD